MLSYMDDTASAERELWKSLQLYSIYRFILAVACVILAYQNTMTPVLRTDTNTLPHNNADLFLQTGFYYFLFSIVMLTFSILQKTKYQIQIHLGLYCDILFLLVIMHAWGGIFSGMGLLLIVTAAAHSILSPGKLSLLSAALISIGLLVEYAYSAILQDNPFYASRQVGLLGLIVFLTSILVNFLALKALKRQSIIHQQSIQLASSFQLNAIIVNSMLQGVIVLDQKKSIKFSNAVTLRLLGLKPEAQPKHVDDLPPYLRSYLVNWFMHAQRPTSLEISSQHTKIRLEISEFGEEHTNGLLIFLYDIKTELKKAQDLKLRALGHLTANIAHEIRNPLSSASHAAQLLQESSTLIAEDLALIKMILSNCNRMNQVIKNVLSLSCQQSNAKVIELNQWLDENLIYLKFQQYPNAIVHFKSSDQPIWVNIDQSHLTQILVNLCENGLRYSSKKVAPPIVTVQIGVKKSLNQAYLDIIDQGDGIPESLQEFIFEPFFTTEKTGTGLGLYLARELSQINGVYLNYQKGLLGSQFRMTFQESAV